MKNSKGFTLIEVLVVVVIFAIGAAIAIPNLTAMAQKNRVRVAVRQLKDQMAKARMSAIELNIPILIAFDPFVSGVCNGYQIVQDTNGDCEVDAGEITSAITLTGMSIIGNDLTPNDAGKPIVQWDTRGLPRQKNGALPSDRTILFSGMGTQFKVVLALTGNISIEKI